MEDKLEATLLACTMPDTASIRQAEEALQRQLRGKNSILSLVRVISNSQHAGVRQLASILLRLKLSMHWIKLSAQEQEFCKRTLLEILLKESVRTVCLGVSHAIATLAKHQFAAGPNGWPDLLTVIMQARRDAQNANHRELGYMLMYTLTETIGTSLSTSLPEVAQSLLFALQTESDPRVFCAVLRTVSAMIEFLSEDEEVMLFQPLVMPLLEALAKEDFGHDDFAVTSIVQVVEVISTMSESPLAILVPFIAQTCVVLSKLVINRSIHESIRSAAATALSDVLGSKPRLISKKDEAYQAALHACLELSRETAATSAASQRPSEEPLDDDDISLRNMTEMVIATYAASLPTKLVVETLLRSAAMMIQNQSDQIGREAGLIVLIVASEGMATELVESHADTFDQLLLMVMDCVTRSEQSLGTTRHALILLSQWAEYLWPLMENHAATVIPAAIHLASAHNTKVFPEASMVLQQYCGGMEEEEIAPFVDDICNCAMRIFEPGYRRTPLIVKSAIETLSYVSVGAGPKFASHFDRCMHIIAPLMSSVGPEYSEVRAHSTALMGQLAVVSTKCTPPGMSNPFLPFVPELLAKCFEGLSREDVADLDYRDSVHHLFANAALAMDVAIEPFLQKMIEALLVDCVSNDDDVMQQVVDRDGIAHVPESLKAIATEIDDVEASSSDDDDDDEHDGNVKVLTSVREAAADSKASAFAALETICDVFALSNLPNEVVAQSTAARAIDRIVEISCGTIEEYLHPVVRSNAIGALCSAVLLAYKCELPNEAAKPDKQALFAFASTTFKDADLELKWLPGRNLASLVPRTMQLMDETVMPYLLEAMTSDRSKVVAAKACETLERIAQLTGPTLIGTEPKEILESVSTLLLGQGACQKNDESLHRNKETDDDHNGADDEDDDDEDDEERRHDEILTDAMVEVVANVAKALGREIFAPLMGIVMPSLIKRSRPKMPLKDRVASVGCLSLILGVTNAIEPKYSEKVARMAVEALKQDEDSCLRRNGLVLCGVLIDMGDRHINPLQVLTILKPILDSHSGTTKQRRWEVEDDMAVLDNTCSVIARILRRPDLSGELRKRVLVEFLQYLPLKFDHEEDWLVYATLGSLAESCEAEILSSMLNVCYNAADDIEGPGTITVFLQLCDVLVSRIGMNNVRPEFVEKLMTKKQSLPQQ